MLVWSCPSGKEPPMTDPGSPPGRGPDRDGIEAKAIVLEQLGRASSPAWTPP